MARSSKLSAKQKRFVEEYLVDLNATQAAIRAGYSQKTAKSVGNENLTKPDLQQYLSSRMKARETRTQITQDMVLRELAKIGFSDIRKVVRWGDTQMIPTIDADGQEAMVLNHGLSLVGADKIDEDTAAAISEISQGKDGLKIKLYDKKGALVDIGRHLGMFKQQVELTGKDGGPIEVGRIQDMTDEELLALATGGGAGTADPA
jgi:phage terminase small subunit